MKQFARGVKVEARRSAVIKRLESQLKTGVKPSKEDGELIPLTEKDKTRIIKEITVLKERL